MSDKAKEYKECPVCKLSDQKVLADQDYGDQITYECSRCGRYTITGTAEAVAGKSAQLSGWLRERNLSDVEIPLLTSSFLENILDTLPTYSPLEKQNKLLKALELLTSYPGEELSLFPGYDASLAWAENQREFEYYIKSLIDRRLIEIPNPGAHTGARRLSQPLPPIVITAAGWQHLEKNQSELNSKTQAFVAMSFEETLLPVYKDAIEPAIKSTGYNSYRVDVEPHLERIDAKIIAEIKNSRFLVADVTKQKAGVYYEAGFAHGLGIPVIWCVRKDELESVHFDTRQYNHILWETKDELKEKLVDFILATIGKR